MGVNSLPKTVTRLRRDCDLNPGPSGAESSTLTTRLPSHPDDDIMNKKFKKYILHEYEMRQCVSVAITDSAPIARQAA